MKLQRAWPMLLVGMALASTGCTNLKLAFTYQDEVRDGCRRKRVPHQRVVRVPVAQAHPDWAKLQPYRSYTRVGEVSPFAHRFTVRFHCVESHVVHYAVSRDPKTGALVATVEQRGWGMQKRTDKPVHVPTPDSLRKHEKAVRRDVGRSYKGESKVKVSYGGSFRLVQLHEVVPIDPPGPAKARQAWFAQATLRVNRDMTAAIGEPGRWTSGRTRMCVTYGARRCDGAPRWIDFDPGVAATTTRLAALTHSQSPVPPAIRQAFVARALQTARDQLANRPRREIESISIHRRRELSFDGLKQTQSIGFDIFSRPINYRTTRSATGRLRVKVPVTDMVFGTGEASATVSVSGEEFRATVRLTNPKPPAKEASGTMTMLLDMTLTLQDSRGNKHEVKTPVKGIFLVQQGAAAGLQLQIARTSDPRTRLALRRHRFPGTPEIRSFDAHVRVENQPTRWHPGLVRRR